MLSSLHIDSSFLRGLSLPLTLAVSIYAACGSVTAAGCFKREKLSGTGDSRSGRLHAFINSNSKPSVCPIRGRRTAMCSRPGELVMSLTPSVRGTSCQLLLPALWSPHPRRTALQKLGDYFSLSRINLPRNRSPHLSSCFSSKRYLFR